MRKTLVNKFNRGEVDPHALLRLDVEKIGNSAGLVENWFPVRLGPMQYRPGTEYLGDVSGEAYFVDFVHATDDLAQLEFTDDQLRVWVDDEVIERTATADTITNPDFDSSLTGWTDDSDGTGSSSWESGGYAVLIGDGSNVGAMYQTVTISDTGQEHAIRIKILDAPVTFRIGTTVGGSEIFEGELKPGEHSLAFTPNANVTYWFSNRERYGARVDSIDYEGSGEMTFATGIDTDTLPLIRTAQSADVVFVAAKGVKQQEILRFGTKSWSLVDYRADDGPFGTINTTGITLTPGDLNGDTTLTASDNLFKPGHVGALFRLASSGQNRSASVSSADAGTESIRVTGVDASRQFTVRRTGTWSATVTLQRSSDNSSWTDVEDYTSNGTKTFDDGLDNSIFFYRLYVKPGDYTSGTVELELNYASGSIQGIGRVISYTSPTVVTVQAVEPFGATEATEDWYEGEWSEIQGYPSAVHLFESRLWWAGKDRLWASISDAFRSFDDETEGDSNPISKTIGFGPVDDVHWLIAINQLVMGLASDEITVRSSSFSEALTSTNTNLRGATSQGSANIAPIKADNTVYFVQRSLERIFEGLYDIQSDSLAAADIMLLNPSICRAGIKRIAVSRQPETRIFVILNDGEARVYLVDPSEDVRCWSRMTTDGDYEDVVVMPGTKEDRVYFLVNRTNGRHWEKLALFREAVGDSASKHLDSFKAYTSPGTTITGLSHLNGKTVYVWADGQDRGSFTVSSGSITVPTAWTDVVVGLRHTAKYQSNRLDAVIGKKGYVNIGQNRRVTHLGIVSENLWRPTLKYGPDDSTLYNLPAIEDGTDADDTALVTDYDEQPFEFDGSYDPDSRVYLQAQGPATLLALVYDIDDPDYQAGKSGES